MYVINTLLLVAMPIQKGWLIALPYFEVNPLGMRTPFTEA